VEAFKVVSRMEKMSTSGIPFTETTTVVENNLSCVGSASNRRPPFPRPRRLHNTMEHPGHWRQGAGMTRVSFPAQSRSSRQWQPSL
jgi:hypothetical protein